MNSKNELNNSIFLVTQKIQEELPELTKYLDEIPEHFSTLLKDEVTTNELKEYLGSLNNLFQTFSKSK